MVVQIKSNFLFLEPILDVAVLKSNHEEAGKKFYSPCNRILNGHINTVWRQADIPKGDRINSETEDLLVPVFVTINPIQRLICSELQTGSSLAAI